MSTFCDATWQDSAIKKNNLDVKGPSLGRGESVGMGRDFSIADAVLDFQQDQILHDPESAQYATFLEDHKAVLSISLLAVFEILLLILHYSIAQSPTDGAKTWLGELISAAVGAVMVSMLRGANRPSAPDQLRPRLSGTIAPPRIEHFGVWDTKISQDWLALECHAHGHLALTEKGQATLASHPKYEHVITGRHAPAFPYDYEDANELEAWKRQESPGIV
ncbi:hypothetical protein DFS34DRAFT_654078 [Phlyctochytrium arcticum]|nr:hypothetical protein DFS34DRAFT_654078 [Phlyctochytrium arcticum]